MAEEEEYVQLTVPEVFGYKIPPKSSAAGHKASDWKDQVWCGKLLVVTKGKNVAIKLVSEEGKIFAVAPVRKDGPPAAEKVSDSSRYFVLRIENAAGAYAFIGVGFNNRSDAFDFNVALQDASKDVDESKAASLLDIGPLGTDFSLKQGEKITIKVNIDGKKRTGEGSSAAPAAAGGLRLKAPAAAAGVGGAAASGGVAVDDFLGIGHGVAALSVGAAGSKPAASAAPAAPAASSWETF